MIGQSMADTETTNIEGASSTAWQKDITVKCLVEYPYDLSALLPLYDLV